jgi:hypothetical protein
MMEETRVTLFADESEAIPDELLNWERILFEEPEVGAVLGELSWYRRRFGKPYSTLQR